MGIYAKYVLPRLINLAMRNKDMTRLRSESIPQAHGDVLEIGIGSGLNLPFYSSAVHHVYGVDPSIELQQMASKSKQASAESIKVTFFRQSAEDALPLEDSSIDTIVMTWSLCSIPNPAVALQQMKRVLKADGRLIFVEHGRSPERHQPSPPRCRGGERRRSGIPRLDLSLRTLHRGQLPRGSAVAFGCGI